jgi:hypothetical protein
MLIIKKDPVPHPFDPVTGDRDFLLTGELAWACRQERVCDDRWRIISHPCGGFFADGPVRRVASTAVGSRAL